MSEHVCLFHVKFGIKCFFEFSEIMSLPGGGPAKTGLHGEGVEHLVVPEYDSSPC